MNIYLSHAINKIIRALRYLVIGVLIPFYVLFMILDVVFRLDIIVDLTERFLESVNRFFYLLSSRFSLLDKVPPRDFNKAVQFWRDEIAYLTEYACSNHINRKQLRAVWQEAIDHTNIEHPNFEYTLTGKWVRAIERALETAEAQTMNIGAPSSTVNRSHLDNPGSIPDTVV